MYETRVNTTLNIIGFFIVERPGSFPLHLLTFLQAWRTELKENKTEEDWSNTTSKHTLKATAIQMLK